MKFRSILTMIVSLAATVLLCATLANAQSYSDSNASLRGNSSPDAQSEAAQMVPAEAVLVQTINARDVHPGQKFQAKLNDSVRLKNGVKLPKGTTLEGTVSTDSMQANGMSRLALRFTRADLKNGKDIPIEASIVGVAGPSYGEAWDGSGAAAPPAPWNGKSLQVDELGAVSGFDLHSAIAGRNSGVLVSSKKDNVKLAAQTQFSLAIAARNTNHMSGGA